MQRTGPDIDLTCEMKRSGLSAICTTLATEYQQGDAYDRFLKGMASMDRQLKGNGMKRSLTPAVGERMVRMKSKPKLGQNYDIRRSRSTGTVLPHTETRPLPQKTIGILGGMSNQATSEYYRMLNERLNARLGGWDNGEIVIVSVNFGNIEYFVRQEQWDEAERYLTEKIGRLERAGADLILCVSNTLHRVVEPIMATRATPFIHIADPTGAAIQRAGLRTIGLLGTMPAMRSEDLRRRYRDSFGVGMITPNDADMVIVDRIIFDELVRRDLRAESKREYLRIVDDLRARGAEGVILGCTEIFLLIGQADLPGFPVFDTTELHVDAAVEFVLASQLGEGCHRT